MCSLSSSFLIVLPQAVSWRPSAVSRTSSSTLHSLPLFWNPHSCTSDSYTLRPTHRRALLHVFFVVIVLDSPASGCELAAFSSLQNLELRIAFLATLLEPTLVYEWLVHLAANPFHPMEAPILEKVSWKVNLKAGSCSQKRIFRCK